jgi:actin-like ATPase involved in cell morphogenesis
LLKNLDKRIREETGLPVSIADDPLASVVADPVPQARNQDRTSDNELCAGFGGLAE